MMVWLTERGTTMLEQDGHAGIRSKPMGNKTVPAYLTILDPDGPLPGETWMHEDPRAGDQEVKIVRPESVGSDGEVRRWWCDTGDYFLRGHIEDLRPIPSTVTKTIRVTGSEDAVEDAIGFIDKLNSGGVTVEVSDE